MRLVVDAVGVRPGSAAIVIGNVLAGWRVLAPADQIVVLVDGAPQFAVPEGVQVQSLAGASAAPLVRLWAQSIGVRRAARAHRADALISAVTAGAFLGANCPRGAIVYDLRHELRPTQFSAKRRVGRRVLYGWTFWRADALFCISERTRNDLVGRHPRTRGKALATPLGADHASGWHSSEAPGRPYVLAFGHFAHKNVDGVLRAWQAYIGERTDIALRVCGLGRAARPAAEQVVAELGLTASVELLPWLSDEEFESNFAGAALVLFPSDFEGFGLPAIEAMLLGIPVVVSDDPALLEVTDGRAVVVTDDGPQTLAGAIDRALNLTEDEIAAAAEHARTFTWERTAGQMRDALRAGAIS
ncbi:MAG: hypothetical protein QOC66_3396 [Pseudonocardiales bacterium]|jgi:glycosyltransferase involved in cell wall biosynthesis|nr:hypothetical protein [Pseudonocardiales bacterium]